MALDLADKTINNHNLTNVNGVTEEVSSLPFSSSSKAASLASASSQCLSAVDASDLKPTGSFTIEGWVKTSNDGMIFQTYAENTNPAGIFVNINSGNIQFLIGKNTGLVSGTDYKIVTSSGVTVTDGAYHHIACVWNGSTMTVYIDTVDRGNASWANTPAYQATNYVRIGCKNSDGTNIQFFNGKIDDFRFWNIERTSTEIANNYQNELTGNELGLVAYWPFEAFAHIGSMLQMFK